MTTRTRIASLVGACALLAVTLTGCLKVDADLTINSEAQGTGTVGFELQKEAAGFMGISDLAAFENSVTTGDLSDTGLGSLATCETSETDLAYVYTCSFADQPFTDSSDMWTIAKSGDTVTFHMVNAGQSGTDGADSAALLGDSSLGSVNVKVTFPGAITELTGSAATKTSDTTATISGTFTDPLDVTITSEAGSGGPKIAALLVVLGALAVVVLIVIVIVVLLVRRRKPAENAAAVVATETVVLDDAGAPTEVVETVTETVVEEVPEAPTDSTD